MHTSTTKALQLIAREALRTQSKYDHVHDDEHVEGELALAASTYAKVSTDGMIARANVRRSTESWTPSDRLGEWPFDEAPKLGANDSNSSRIHELVKAGNLIVAEIARRLRSEG